MDSLGKKVTLQYVIDAIPAYSRLVLGSGVYNEQISISRPIEIVGEKGDEPVITNRGTCVLVHSDVTAYLSGLKIRTKQSQRSLDRAISVSSNGIPNAFLPQTHTHIRNEPPAVLISAGTPVFFKCNITSVLVAGTAAPVVERCIITGNLGGSGINIKDNASGNYLSNDITSHSHYCIESTTRGNPVFSLNDVHARHDDNSNNPGMGLVRVSGGITKTGMLSGITTKLFSKNINDVVGDPESISTPTAPDDYCASFINNKFDDIFTERQMSMGAVVIAGNRVTSGVDTNTPHSLNSVKRVVTGTEICAQRCVFKIEGANVLMRDNIIEGGVVGVCLTGNGGELSGCVVSNSIFCGLYLGPNTSCVIRSSTISNHRSGGMLLDESQALIEDCNITGCRGPGVSVKNCIDFAVEKTLFEHNRGAILCSGSCTGIIYGCSFMNNELMAIKLNGSDCLPRITECTFVHNGSVAITCQYGSSPIISKNMLQNHSVAAIVSEFSGCPKCFDNEIRNNKKYGILCDHKGRGFFSENVISESSMGIRVQDGSCPAVAHNTFLECITAIDVAAGAIGTYQENTMKSNENGFMVSGYADPYVFKNVINGSTKYGIIVSVDGLGTYVENNMVNNNVGFATGDGSLAVFRRNVIQDSAVSGCSLNSGNQSLVQKNTFLQNKLYGCLLTGENSNATVIRNSFVRTEGCALMSEKGAKGEVVCNTFTGNGEGGYGTCDGGMTYFTQNTSKFDRGASIFCYNGGQGVFEWNKVEDSLTNGCHIYSKGNPKINNCSFEKCGTFGLLLADGAGGSISECVTRLNTKAGICIVGNCSSTLHDIIIEDNPEIGILLAEDASGTTLTSSIIRRQPVGVKAVNSGSAAIRKCTFVANTCGAMIVKNGSATFQECDFTASETTHVEFSDGGHATFDKCAFGMTPRSTVVSRTKGQGLLVNCTIKENEEYGVIFEHSGDTKLLRCTITECIVGIIGRERGMGVVEECIITRNHVNNVELLSNTTTILRGCTIEQCYIGCGIFCQGDNGVIQQCQIVRNRYHGVYLSEACYTIIQKECRIHHNRKSGVYCASRAAGKVDGSEITGNIESGVTIEEAATTSIVQCCINYNYSGGILCYPRARGSVERCELSDNDIANIRLMYACATRITSNIIHGHKAYGISVEGSASIVDGNEISNHDPGGVYVTGFSQCMIRDNIIRENIVGVKCDIDGRSTLPFPPVLTLYAACSVALIEQYNDQLKEAFTELAEISEEFRQRLERLRLMASLEIEAEDKLEEASMMSTLLPTTCSSNNSISKKRKKSFEELLCKDRLNYTPEQMDTFFLNKQRVTQQLGALSISVGDMNYEFLETVLNKAREKQESLQCDSSFSSSMTKQEKDDCLTPPKPESMTVVYLLNNEFRNNNECGVLLLRNSVATLSGNVFMTETVGCHLTSGVLGDIRQCSFLRCHKGIRIDGYAIATVVSENTFSDNDIAVHCIRNTRQEVDRIESPISDKQQTFHLPSPPSSIAGSKFKINSALAIPAAVTVVEHNTFRMNKFFSVLIANYSETYVAQNVFEGDTGVSVGSVAGARAYVDGNNFMRCLVGIQLASLSSLTVLNNQITEDNQIGVLCTGGTGVIKNNIIARCFVSGLLVEGNASPDVHGNLFTKNDQTGFSSAIYTRNGGNGNYYNNDIHENSIGVRSEFEGCGNFYKNFIHDNVNYGILVTTQAHPLFTGCNFIANGIADVCIKYGGSPTVTKSLFTDSCRPLWVNNNGGGQFSFNMLRGAAQGKSALLVEFDPKVVVIDSQSSSGETRLQRRSKVVVKEVTAESQQIVNPNLMYFLTVTSNCYIPRSDGDGDFSPSSSGNCNSSSTRQRKVFNSSIAADDGGGRGLRSKGSNNSSPASVPQKELISAVLINTDVNPYENVKGALKNSQLAKQKNIVFIHRNFITNCSIGIEVDCGGANAAYVSYLYSKLALPSLKLPVALRRPKQDPSKAVQYCFTSQHEQIAVVNTIASTLPDMSLFNRSEYGALVSENYISQCNIGILVHNGPPIPPVFIVYPHEKCTGSSTTTDNRATVATASSILSVDTEFPSTNVVAEDDCVLAQFESNTVIGGDIGILIKRGGHSRFEHNYVMRSAQLNLLISDEGRGEFLENVFTESGFHGVVVQSNSHVAVVHSNEQSSSSHNNPQSSNVYPNIQSNLISNSVRNGLVISSGDGRYYNNHIAGHGDIGVYVTTNALGVFHRNVVYDNKRVGMYLTTMSLVLISNCFYAAGDRGAFEIHAEGIRLHPCNTVKNQFSPRYGNYEGNTSQSLQSPTSSQPHNNYNNNWRKAEPATKLNAPFLASGEILGKDKEKKDETDGYSQFTEARVLKNAKDVLTNLTSLHCEKLQLGVHSGCKRLDITLLIHDSENKNLDKPVNEIESEVEAAPTIATMPTETLDFLSMLHTVNENKEIVINSQQQPVVAVSHTIPKSAALARKTEDVAPNTMSARNDSVTRHQTTNHGVIFNSVPSAARVTIAAFTHTAPQRSISNVNNTSNKKSSSRVANNNVLTFKKISTVNSPNSYFNGRKLMSPPRLTQTSRDNITICSGTIGSGMTADDTQQHQQQVDRHANTTTITTTNLMMMGISADQRKSMISPDSKAISGNNNSNITKQMALTKRKKSSSPLGEEGAKAVNNANNDAGDNINDKNTEKHSKIVKQHNSPSNKRSYDDDAIIIPSSSITYSSNQNNKTSVVENTSDMTTTTNKKLNIDFDTSVVGVVGDDTSGVGVVGDDHLQQPQSLLPTVATPSSNNSNECRSGGTAQLGNWVIIKDDPYSSSSQLDQQLEEHGCLLLGTDENVMSNKICEVTPDIVPTASNIFTDNNRFCNSTNNDDCGNNNDDCMLANMPSGSHHTNDNIMLGQALLSHLKSDTDLVEGSPSEWTPTTATQYSHDITYTANTKRSDDHTICIAPPINLTDGPNTSYHEDRSSAVNTPPRANTAANTTTTITTTTSSNNISEASTINNACTMHTNHTLHTINGTTSDIVENPVLNSTEVATVTVNHGEKQKTNDCNNSTTNQYGIEEALNTAAVKESSRPTTVYTTNPNITLADIDTDDDADHNKRDQLVIASIIDTDAPLLLTSRIKRSDASSISCATDIITTESNSISSLVGCKNRRSSMKCPQEPPNLKVVDGYTLQESSSVHKNNESMSNISQQQQQQCLMGCEQEILPMISTTTDNSTVQNSANKCSSSPKYDNRKFIEYYLKLNASRKTPLDDDAIKAYIQSAATADDDGICCAVKQQQYRNDNCSVMLQPLYRDKHTVMNATITTDDDNNHDNNNSIVSIKMTDRALQLEPSDLSVGVEVPRPKTVNNVVDNRIKKNIMDIITHLNDKAASKHSRSRHLSSATSALLPHSAAILQINNSCNTNCVLSSRPLMSSCNSNGAALVTTTPTIPTTTASSSNRNNNPRPLLPSHAMHEVISDSNNNHNTTEWVISPRVSSTNAPIGVFVRHGASEAFYPSTGIVTALATIDGCTATHR